MAGRPRIGEHALTPAQRAHRAREKRLAQEGEGINAVFTVDAYERAIKIAVRRGIVPANVLEASDATTRAHRFSDWLTSLEASQQ